MPEPSKKRYEKILAERIKRRNLTKNEYEASTKEADVHRSAEEQAKLKQMNEQYNEPRCEIQIGSVWLDSRMKMSNGYVAWCFFCVDSTDQQWVRGVVCDVGENWSLLKSNKIKTIGKRIFRAKFYLIKP